MKIKNKKSNTGTFLRLLFENLYGMLPEEVKKTLQVIIGIVVAAIVSYCFDLGMNWEDDLSPLGIVIAKIVDYIITGVILLIIWGIGYFVVLSIHSISKFLKNVVNKTNSDMKYNF